MASIADAIRRLRQGVGNIADTLGTTIGLPETGLSERIAGGPTVNTARNFAYASEPNQSKAPNQSTYIPGSSETDPRFADYRPSTPASGGGDQGGGGGGGGGLTEADLRSRGYNDPNAIAGILNDPGRSSQLYQEFFGGQRNAAEEQSRKALEAALGTFNTKAQNLRGQIPGIQERGELRSKGLDEELASFLETANREEGSRVGSLEASNKQIEDVYSTAERSTRSSAKGLARKLRDLYASAGTLDSTQYRDRNIEQSQEVLQALGDVRREGAGKTAAGIKEIEDVKGYYGEQRTQQQRSIALAKDKIKADTDSEIQGILGDINLTDSQKIEAVVEAQGRLDQRLGEIDSRQFETQREDTQRAEDTALKLAELRSKGTSTGYKETQAKQEALNTATSVIKRLSDQFGGSVDQATARTIFAQFGFDEEESDKLSRIYGSYGAGAGGNNAEEDFLRGLPNS